MTAVTWDHGIEGLTEPTWEPELYRTPETLHALQGLLLDLSRRMAERGLSPWTFAETIALLDAPPALPEAPAVPVAQRTAA